MPRKKAEKKEEEVEEVVSPETELTPDGEVAGEGVPVEEATVSAPEVKEDAAPISNDEFLQAKPQTFSNEICKQCGGAGLARPTFVNSEFCGNCKGTGREPITE